MKKVSWAYAAVFGFLVLCLWACAGFKDFSSLETVYGSGKGWGGEIRVVLETDGASIYDIEVVFHKESSFVGVPALEELVALVLDQNSTDVDAVSGATLTSEGFLAAVEDALGKH